MNQTLSNSKTVTNRLVLIAWVVILLISILPDILFREFTGNLPGWLFSIKVALLIVLLAVSFLWLDLRPLRLFLAVLLIAYLLEWGISWFYASLSYSTWFIRTNSFIQQMAFVQIPRLTSGILMVILMLFLFHKPGNFFFIKGDLAAKAEPIPLIMTRPSSWKILGPIIAAAMCLGLVVFSVIFGDLPSSQSLQNALPLLFFVPLFAASNAFGEEILYRAPLLASLENPVGPVHALLISAAYFGISHFYGVPYGILGIALAFIPGWLLGKSMLETRGFFWAWFIHFWMDVVVFTFIALGSVTPGG
jgi:hypothetical protein